VDLLEAGDRKGLLNGIKRHMEKAVQDLTSSQRKGDEASA